MSSTPPGPASTEAGPPVAPRLGARIRRSVGERFAAGVDAAGLRRLDIRWRFRAVVLTFGLPFLVYIVWSSAQQAMLAKVHEQDQSRADAALVATRFEAHIEQVSALLATMSLSMGPRVDQPAAMSALIERMRGYLPKSVDNVGVWSMTGDSIASLDRRVRADHVNVADRRYFQDAISRRDLVFEAPIRARPTDADIIQFARPIFGDDGNVAGVLSMAIRASHLTEQLDPDAKITGQALITIIDDRGTILSRSADPGLWVGRRVADVPGVAAAFENRGGAREETGVDGRRRLAGYAVVGSWPWLVMVGTPIEKVLGPVNDRLLTSLLVGFGILGMAMVIAGRVAAWTTTPLIQLAADAERLGDGDLSHRSSVSASGEIATLANNFNRMAAAIDVRESALAASRTQLRAIADNVPEQITYVDRDERYQFVNTYLGVFKALAPHEIIGRTIREVRGEEAYRAVLPALRRALSGESFTHERSMMMDGREAHFHVTYIPDRDDDGTVKGVYAFAKDITERKAAELLLIESEKRLVTITDNLPAMICYVDANRCFRFANKAWEKWFSLPLADIVGRPFDHMMSPELAAQYEYYFLVGMQGEPCEYEVEVPSATDGTRWLRCTFVPDRDPTTGSVRGVYGMIHNVTKAKVTEQRLTRLARFDTLTGLANRHQFNETFESVLADNDADGRPLALMFLDIDHFKQVNDRHGHASGDLLLKEFARRLAECLRPTDTVARLSGDEFVVLLEGLHTDDEPQFIARKIIGAVEKPFLLDEHFVRISASIGIAMRAHRGEPASVLMKRADVALYDAKRAGRNTFRLAS